MVHETYTFTPCAREMASALYSRYIDSLKGIAVSLGVEGDVPAFEAALFEKAVDDPAWRLDMIEQGGKDVGFYLAYLSSDDCDLCKAPYGELLWTEISPEASASEVLAAAMSELGAWFRQQGVSKIMTAGFACQRDFLEALSGAGFAPIAQRMMLRLG
jgi:hypothetical protein